jgi:hypothetical protein
MKAKREALESIVAPPGGIDAEKNGDVKEAHRDLTEM